MESLRFAEPVVCMQMVTFCVLVFPFPYTIKKKLFNFLSENFIVAKIAYGLKISFMYAMLSLVHFVRSSRCRFVGILFLDALQRMSRVNAEFDMFRTGKVQDARTESSVAARKF